MDRIALERNQVWIYLAAILAGLALGSLAPGLGPLLETLLWPVLGLLLYATFVQVPLLHVLNAFRDGRFALAIGIGNFVLVPLQVWGLMQWLPEDPTLRLGVLLVLLVPCTDWFITFTQFGGGSTAQAIAVTPLNLIAQLRLLPLYLWLMLPDQDLRPVLQASTLLPPALGLIGLPLLAAGLTERWIEARPGWGPLREQLAWWPVSLLGLVLLLIAAAQIDTVRAAGPALGRVLPVFLAYLVGAALIARVLAGWLALPHPEGRALAFSLGTRNSFVVLPFALAPPAGWETAVVVIVFQSLVELFGVLLYLWWLPRVLFPPQPSGGTAES
jgi:arsenite transporter